MNKKSLFITFLIVVLIAIVAAAIIILWPHLKISSKQETSNTIASSTNTTSSISHISCLNNNESASYTATHNKRSSDVGTVVISNKITGVKLSSFTINDVFSDHYHSYEIHACNIYVIRQFNYDYLRGDPLPNYRQELWIFDYDGVGMKLADAEDYRVNDNESMLAFSLFSATSTDSPVLIENLRTNKIIFSLSLSEIPRQYDNIITNFDLENGGWSKDGKYIWFDSNQGSDTLGFIRIDAEGGSYQIFPAPTTTMGGDAFNPDVGMTTYRTDAAPWTGDATIDQGYRDKAQAQGRITSFYIYNLMTKSSYLVTTTTDPTFYFRPVWLSDAELQYIPPSGVTTTYTIPTQ